MRALSSLFAIAVFATLSVPAQAGSAWYRGVDVCSFPDTMVLGDVDGSGGMPTPGDTFALRGAIYPKGTVPEGGLAMDVDSDGQPFCGTRVAPIGVFYGHGVFLFHDGDLADASWHLGLRGKGSIETKGVVRMGRYFSHAVVGRTGRVRTGRVARVVVLDENGFQFRIYFANY